MAYCGEQLLDIYEPELPRTSTAVLLWHGSGANERDVLEPLARQIARAGVRVMVPDWSTDDDTNGRNHLTASLTYVRNFHSKVGAVDRVVLAGWSLGASAVWTWCVTPSSSAAGVPRPLSAFRADSMDRRPLRNNGPRDSSVDPSIPLLLVHGSSDEIVIPERAGLTCEHLRKEGWSVTSREVTTDHAGAIGTVYDPARHRCVPTDDPGRLEVLTTVASLIADLALSG